MTENSLNWIEQDRMGNSINEWAKDYRCLGEAKKEAERLLGYWYVKTVYLNGVEYAQP